VARTSLLCSAVVAVLLGATASAGGAGAANASRVEPAAMPDAGTGTGLDARTTDLRNRDGIVFREYGRFGYRFQPLLSFAALNGVVSSGDVASARRLARALLARVVRRGDALYWEYDFPYHGPAPWGSGFAQAVAAQALARAGVLLHDVAFVRAAEASFRGLRELLLMPLGGGEWVREYEHTHEAILNAQLQSFISLESFAKIVRSPSARRVVAELDVATRRLLPQFDVGCWSRYELGGALADRHYHAYHVELLRRVTVTHREAVWSNTYLRWGRCERLFSTAVPVAPG